MTERVAVAPGSFDPVTLGHLDVIIRAAQLFDRVVVAVGVNAGKQALLPLETRIALIEDGVKLLPAVEVASVPGLLADFCREIGASVIVKGLRGGHDLGQEEPMALVNKRLTGIETVFLSAAPAWGHVSSSLVKDVARHGGDVGAYVTPAVADALAAAFGRRPGVQ
ncbi:MAG: pantetheine-phosphate adenylyltransferase [Bifidobacteriaceae bacterium]|jgi:pantetheine-phosphate adenylyltransferase|nr:pantetheine-phosphate adenylyltransferase [Bifidobacteriaceae bacterium]